MSYNIRVITNANNTNKTTYPGGANRAWDFDPTAVARSVLLKFLERYLVRRPHSRRFGICCVVVVDVVHVSLWFVVCRVTC